MAATLAVISDAQPCNPGVVAIGDSRTSDNGGGVTPWPAQVGEVTIINYGVSGYTWSQCVAKYSAEAGRTRLGTSVECGLNDIFAGTDGHTMFTTEKTWVESVAATNNVIYWQNIAAFGGYNNTPSVLTARLNFNSDWASYCLAPASHVKCVDVSTPLLDPNDATKSIDTIDGVHFNNAGNAIIASAFEGVFP